MKHTLKRLLIVVAVLATLLVTTVFVSAEDKSGDGDYTIIVSNGADTGISIDGHTFHAFQIFSASDVTSFSVTQGFQSFFVGSDMVSGDGSGQTYNFQQYLDVILTYDAATANNSQTLAYESAVSNYDHLAAQYMDSYEENMYTLSEQIRDFLDVHGVYGGGSIDCMAHNEAYDNGDGTQMTVLSGLDLGYYFIFNQESTLKGIGIAASGGFVPLTTSSDLVTTVAVKQSVPTMSKNIFHDDQDKWDIVGDQQIGDAVDFRIITSLPANIADYTDTSVNATATGQYTYVLTDTMSDGLSYNRDLAVYTDVNKQTPVDPAYLTITANDSGFKVIVDVIGYLAQYPENITFYLYYSATINENAVVASEYDQNTATLTYSSNPSDASHTDSTQSTVFHYTFALDVIKTDENGDGLAGARFGLFDENGTALPLTKGAIDTATGVVSYYYDSDATPVSDGGYITTETITLDDGVTTVTGLFQIYGLNDRTTYTLREVEAPTGYNVSDPFEIYFTPTYHTLGTQITNLSDGSAFVYTAQDETTGDWHSSSTIINHLKIYLPSTGGVGTVLFQVGGCALMLGAVAMLLVGQRKKTKK